MKSAEIAKSLLDYDVYINILITKYYAGIHCTGAMKNVMDRDGQTVILDRIGKYIIVVIGRQDDKTDRTFNRLIEKLKIDS